jgi:hypothetical protein
MLSCGQFTQRMQDDESVPMVELGWFAFRYNR